MAAEGMAHPLPETQPAASSAPLKTDDSMLRAPAVAVFDLDGTLADTAPGLLLAVNRRLAHAAVAPLDRAALLPMIGDGARALLARAFSARGLAVPDDAMPAFLAELESRPEEGAAPFPGIPEALDALAAAGFRLAVCTNKPERAARALLAALGLAQHFAAVLGGDSLAVRKPDPAHPRAAQAAAGGGRAAMIGDHANDIAAARAAGWPALFCAWGYGAPAMADGAPVAAHPSDLPGLLAKLLR
jgi:phosphoglycolate phosphatase